MRFTIAAITPLLINSAQAWGTLGHATVGAIAEHYLDAAGRALVTKTLGKGVTMASVASWADNYRYTAPGKWSAPLHYIDAADAPPSSCSVDFDRDCGATGCSISAIANYTVRVTDTTLPAVERTNAMKFLIHFIGDATQPLHDESEAIGGNAIKVTWEGEATNLHSCWDTQMLEKAAGGGNSTSTLATFSQSLIDRIEGGSYATEAPSWVQCIDPAQAQQCALDWAKDANAFNCLYVLKSDESGQELSGDYFVGAEPIIELQIAKAGYRLGLFVNRIAAAAAQVVSV